MTRTYSDAVVVGTLAVVAIAALAIGIVVGGAQGPRPRETTAITLSQAGGTCRPDDVGLLAQYQGKRVIWNIRNNCQTTYYVKVDTFRRRDPQNGNVPSNTPTQVLDNPQEGVTPQPVTGNGGTVRLDAKLKKPVDEGVYKYGVYLSTDGQNWTLVLDPDVDPWP